MGIDIFYDKEYYGICRNVALKKNLYQDLHSETIIAILKYNIDYSSIKNTYHFFSSFAWKTYHSNSFKKKYIITPQVIGLKPEEVSDPSEEEYDFTPDDKIDRVIYEFVKAKEDDRGEYLDLLFRRYMECGQSGYVVSSTYNIPPRTVFAGLKEYREKFKYIYEGTDKG